MGRKVADCRAMPNKLGCTLTMVGDETEVLTAAVEHAVAVHGHKHSPELRAAVRGMLTDETRDAPGAATVPSSRSAAEAVGLAEAAHFARPSEVRAFPQITHQQSAQCAVCLALHRYRTGLENPRSSSNRLLQLFEQT